MILISYILMLTILTLMLSLIPFLNIHKFMDREKSSPFECGFDPFSNSRVSFSIHFLSIMLMFLIFDIEITLIIPLAMTYKTTIWSIWVFSIVILVFILITGLILEWKEGSMNWK